MGYGSAMTENNEPGPEEPEAGRPQDQHDEQRDQDAEPPGSGIEGPVHPDEPAEGP